MTPAPDDANVSEDVLDLTTQIVSSYVTNNPVSTNSIDEIIRSVHSTLVDIEKGGTGAQEQGLTPAVPVKKSITNDYIICLEDGKKLKMLKRYLRTQFGLSPEEYRARWGLPHDYPMVAPSYAKQRSKLAKEIGLGKTAAGRKK